MSYTDEISPWRRRCTALFGLLTLQRRVRVFWLNEDVENFTDREFSANGLLQRKVLLDLISIPAPLAIFGDVSAGGEIAHDAVSCVFFGDAERSAPMSRKAVLRVVRVRTPAPARRRCKKRSGVLAMPSSYIKTSSFLIMDIYYMY